MILAILSWNQMANIEFKNCYATKRKENLLKAQWVNETCRDLQAKLIKIAAFCHNRALKIFFRLAIGCCLQQDLSHRLLLTTGSFASTASPFSSEPDVQRIQRTRTEG